MPITWRNVGQTVGAGTAADLMSGATRSIESGLEKITDAARNVTDDRQREFDFKVDQNVSAYFDRLQQLDTPEDLQAAKDSGELDALVSSFGDYIDHDRIRGAFDQAMSRERDEFMAENEFQLAQAREAAQPLYQQFVSLENPADQAAFLEENMDIFQNARMAGDMRQELFHSESRARAEEERIKNKQEEEWIDELSSVSMELATSDDNFYGSREKFLEYARKKEIPARIYGPIYNQFIQDYATSTQMSPEDTIEIEQMARFSEVQLKNELDNHDVELQRSLAANPIDPQLPWNQVTPASAREILESNSISQPGQYRLFDETATETLRRITVTDDLTERIGGRPKAEMHELLKANKDEILAYAATKLEPRGVWSLDVGERRKIKGGRAEVEKAVLDAVNMFLGSQRQQVARDEALRRYNDNVAASRALASGLVTDVENEARVRAGLKIRNSGSGSPESASAVSSANNPENKAAERLREHARRNQRFNPRDMLQQDEEYDFLTHSIQ